MGKQGQGVSCQPLHTSIHPRLWEYSASSSQVSWIAELLLPRGEDSLEALEGHIQVGTHPVRVGKRADAAHCMAL